MQAQFKLRGIGITATFENNLSRIVAQLEQIQKNPPAGIGRGWKAAYMVRDMVNITINGYFRPVDDRDPNTFIRIFKILQTVPELQVVNVKANLQPGVP